MQNSVLYAHGWKVEYNAYELPFYSYPQWVKTGKSTNTLQQLGGGILHTKDWGINEGKFLCYLRKWKANPEVGATVEVRLKIISSSSDFPGGNMVVVDDGLHGMGFTFLKDSIVNSNLITTSHISTKLKRVKAIVLSYEL